MSGADWPMCWAKWVDTRVRICLSAPAHQMAILLRNHYGHCVLFFIRMLTSFHALFIFLFSWYVIMMDDRTQLRRTHDQALLCSGLWCAVLQYEAEIQINNNYKYNNNHAHIIVMWFWVVTRIRSLWIRVNSIIVNWYWNWVLYSRLKEVK